MRPHRRHFCNGVRRNPILSIYDTVEGARLLLIQQKKGHWNRWGPFLSERAWGTVREDYSADGNAWDYLPHDHARSRTLSLERGRFSRHL